jgi:hypothetical protein
MIRVTGLSAGIHLPHKTIVEELRRQRLFGFRDGVGPFFVCTVYIDT